MDLNEIAAAWLETPNGRKWALVQIKANLAKLPSVTAYDDDLIRGALDDLKTPSALLTALRGEVGLTTEPASSVYVPVVHDAGGDEPWRSAELPFDVCAEVLDLPRAELAGSWNELTVRSGIPETLTGWEIVVLDIYRWLEQTTHPRPDKFARGLLREAPKGRNWGIILRRGKCEIHPAPLQLDASAYGRIRSFYDPLDRIEAIEAAAEALACANPGRPAEVASISEQIGQLPLGDRL